LGQTSNPTRVCIVDDHQVVREGVRWVLEATGDFEVIGEASNAREGLAVVLRVEPDVAIIDARLPGGDGIRLVRSIRSRNPNILCLILTSFPAHEALYEAVLAGASGFVTKDVEATTLIEAIRKVGVGGSVLDWNLVPGEEFVSRPSPAVADIVADLTQQERRILELIAEGRTNQEIADTLFLAEKTVRNYVSNLLGKLGTKNRTQAATLLVTLRANRRTVAQSA
jgi:two-component system, NarL family, response regulator DevR